MRNDILYTFLVIMLILISGCDKNQKVTQYSNNNEKITFYNNFMYYDNIEQLNKKTTIIIDGTVLKKYPSENVNITLSYSGKAVYEVATQYDIRVNNSVKGKYKTGNSMRIQISGGVFEGKEYDYGLKQLNVNDNMIFFLRDFESIKPDYPAVLINDSQGSIAVNDKKLKVHPNNLLFADFDKKDKDRLIEELKSKMK